MDGQKSGNIPGFMVQDAAAFEKAPTGGETGEGERGAPELAAGALLPMQVAPSRRREELGHGVTRRRPVMRDRRTRHRNGPGVRQGADADARSGGQQKSCATMRRTGGSIVGEHEALPAVNPPCR
jgi:hypothetical protein